MLKAKDLINESDEELSLKLDTLQKEIYALRGQKLDAKTQKIHLVSEKKKEVARILTIKRERELLKREP